MLALSAASSSLLVEGVWLEARTYAISSAAAIAARAAAAVAMASARDIFAGEGGGEGRGGCPQSGCAAAPHETWHRAAAIAQRLFGARMLPGIQAPNIKTQPEGAAEQRFRPAAARRGAAARAHRVPRAVQ